MISTNAISKMNGKRKGASLSSDEKHPKRLETNTPKDDAASINSPTINRDHIAANDNEKDRPTEPRIGETSFASAAPLNSAEIKTKNTNTQTEAAHTKMNVNVQGNGAAKHRVDAHHSVLPLSLQLMKPFAWTLNYSNCNCAPDGSYPTYGGAGFPRPGNMYHVGHKYHQESTPSFIGRDGRVVNVNGMNMNNVGMGNELENQKYCSPIWTQQDGSTSTGTRTTSGVNIGVDASQDAKSLDMASNDGENAYNADVNISYDDAKNPNFDAYGGSEENVPNFHRVAIQTTATTGGTSENSADSVGNTTTDTNIDTIAIQNASRRGYSENSADIGDIITAEGAISTNSNTTNRLRNRFSNGRNRTVTDISSSDDAGHHAAITSARQKHLESIPPTPRDYTLTILQEYIGATQLYGCSHVNPGVLTAFRFSLPTLRVSGNFHDSDMLALSEVLFRHCNGALKHIRRLDFSIAGRYGKLHGRKGFGSHGAFTLSRVLSISNHIEEVFVTKNQVGPYGAAALFAAICKNPVLRILSMRKCNIGERGAFAFVEYMQKSRKLSLQDVDLSVNGIGFRGSIRIEEMLILMEENGCTIDVDLEGNLVIQEIMNGVTHGLGFILCLVGFSLMNFKVKDGDLNKRMSCLAYSLSLLVLYISSTLYHSFFALKYTRYIFECLDHCAIYILITGSYTPFLRIALHDKPIGSFYLLIFIYLCCFGGVFVEAFHNTWIHKPKFSLAMYLGMGWSCMICLSDMMEVLPQEAVNLIILGGIGYTSGVPFFVRNNNLDHSIWHCFVLAGSIFHWLCVYWYVAPM